MRVKSCATVAEPWEIHHSLPRPHSPPLSTQPVLSLLHPALPATPLRGGWIPPSLKSSPPRRSRHSDDPPATPASAPSASRLPPAVPLTLWMPALVQFLPSHYLPRWFTPSRLSSKTLAFTLALSARPKVFAYSTIVLSKVKRILPNFRIAHTLTL